MLPLDSPRWGELRHAYGQASDAPEMILRVIREPSDEAWDAVFGCLLHQGDVYTATYAAVPHLLEAAIHRPHGEQIQHWSFIAGVAVRQVLDGLDQDVLDAYHQALAAARPILLRVLEAHRFSTIQTLYLLGAAAALHGNSRMAWGLGPGRDRGQSLRSPVPVLRRLDHHRTRQHRPELRRPRNRRQRKRNPSRDPRRTRPRTRLG